MTHVKATQPKRIPKYLHVGVTEAYSWDNYPDFTAEEAGAKLNLVLLINDSEEPPRWAGSTSHLYTERLEIPVPSFDPVEKRLEAVDHELADIRQQFYSRKKQLEEQRKSILAITFQDQPTTEGGDYIPKGDLSDDDLPL